MSRLIRCSALFLVVGAALWVALMNVLPVLFIRQMEKKYSIHLNGERQPVLFYPRFQMKKASFVWRDRVELVDGQFEVTINPFTWIRSRIWAIELKGDGSRLRFLGDWLKKTGVSEIKTNRLRLALDFYGGEIQDIHQVEVIAPDYQFQIQSRMVPR